MYVLVRGNNYEDNFISDSIDSNLREKRSIDFMGMRVNYPQYLRLVQLQKEVIKIDKAIRKYSKYGFKFLAGNKDWITLVYAYQGLKKFLPKEYLDSVGHSDPLSEWKNFYNVE